MQTITIKEKLHRYIDTLEAKKIKAMYTIFEDEIEEENIYTEEFKTVLDKRYKNYESSKTKMITATESQKRIQTILKEKVI